MSTPVVFIHGMFLTPLCWEGWMERFESAGRQSHAPAWPAHEGSVIEMRARQPDPSLGNLGFGDVVEAMASLVALFPEKPVIVGHSMGGLVVQVLLQRDLAVAGAAIDSAAPAGVFTTQPSFLKSNWPMINPLHSAHKPHMMTVDEFAYAFANTMSEAEQIAAYDRYVVPESRAVPRDSLGRAGHVDFSAAHPPLLLVAGGEDHIIPTALNQHMFERYKASDSVVELKEFPSRDHLTIVEPGWEEVADFVLEWLDRQNV